MNQKSENTDTVQQDAEEIVKQQGKIAEEIEKLVVSSAKVGERGAQSIASIYSSVVSGSLAALDRAVPADQERALRQVYDGLTNAGTRFANAARYTFEEARSESKIFSETEIKQTKDELAALETLAIETLLKYKDKVSSELSQQTSRIVEHGKNTSSDLGKAISDALTVVRDHPAELISDGAKAGVELSRSIAKTLLQGSADLLSSAAKSLDKKQE